MNLTLSTKAKEAIKVSLAMVLVYGIALKVNWMNPSWAGFAVAMIALATAGQSIHKGLLRIAGTIPGAVMALVILSLASQSRWTFVLLASSWIFFATYMMIVDKERSYMWNVAGFVCLIILVSGPTSSEDAFRHAVYRSLETVMGVVVYTLISVFLWPRTNAGAIKKASEELVATQARLINTGRDIMIGRRDKENLAELYTQEVQQLGQVAAALQAEGSESYEVHALKDQWDRFHSISGQLMEAIDRWGTGFAQLSGIDINAVISGLPAFFGELDERFENIQQMLGNTASSKDARGVQLTIDHKALQSLPSLERAALADASKNLQRIEKLSGSMLECVSELNGECLAAGDSGITKPHQEKRKGFALPVIDLDHLKGAGFAAITVFIGFCVWIFFDPPGHAGWFEFSGIIAMAMAAMQQFKPSMLGKPLLLASAMCLGVYVFIMPDLSTFLGLGSLLFVLVFITAYFFTGLARVAGMVAIINEISIQNPQSYNFAAMANALVYMLLVFFFLMLLSYLLGSSRPEKVVLKLCQRYFRSVEYLIQLHMRSGSHEGSWFRPWREDFHRYEIRTLPGKIAAWGRAIDHKLFPANSQQQVQALVTSLEMLSIRVEMLLEAGEGIREHELIASTKVEIQPWINKIQLAFKTWSQHPETFAGKNTDLQSRLTEALNVLEGRIDKILEQQDTSSLTEVDGERYFRLLGGLRGVSEASVAYAGIAGEIDWLQWREEKFS